MPLPAATETIRSYAETWLSAVAPTLKQSTVRFYRDNFENHIYPVLGSQPLERTTRVDVKCLLTALTRRR